MKKNKSHKKLNISILGAGSWGGTIAWLLSNKKYNVKVWTFSKDEYNYLTKTQSLLRPKKLKFNKYVTFTRDLNSISKNSDIIIFAVPGTAFKATAAKLKKLRINKKTILVSATKGITKYKEQRPSVILSKLFKQNQIAVLSGPNIALDVISNSPVISIIATKNNRTAHLLQNIFTTKYFRIYTNSDIHGVETAGALKNVIAIAAGMSDGFGFSISTKASLISRGLIEIGRIATKEGAKTKTLLSAAAIGDLITTCYSPNSRNYKVGYALGKGKKLNHILKNLGEVAEGVETVKSMHKLAKKYKINTPLCSAIFNVVVKSKNPKSELKKLLNRPTPKDEIEL